MVNVRLPDFAGTDVRDSEFSDGVTGCPVVVVIPVTVTFTPVPTVCSLPTQLNPKFSVPAVGDTITVSLPDVALVPLQPLLAMHETAFVEDHASVV